MKRAVISAITLVILAVGTSVPVAADVELHSHQDLDLVFRAKRLGDCITRKTDEGHIHAEPVRAAGIRFYAKDGWKGRSVTYCLRVHALDCIHCNEAFPHGNGIIRFPRDHRMFRNVESIKVIGEFCDLTLIHRTKDGPVGWGGRGGGRSVEPAIFHPNRNKGRTIFKTKVEIPESWDDRFWKLSWNFDCG